MRAGTLTSLCVGAPALYLPRNFGAPSYIGLSERAVNRSGVAHIGEHVLIDNEGEAHDSMPQKLLYELRFDALPQEEPGARVR